MTLNIEKPGSDTTPGPPAATVRLTPAMDDDAIIRAFGYNPDVIKSAKLYTSGAFSSRVTDPTSTLAQVARASVPGTSTATLGGVVHGLRQLPAGALQLAARTLHAAGLYGDADVQYHDLLEKLAESDYQQNVMQGKNVDSATGKVSPWDIGTLTGQALTPLPIPAPGVLASGGQTLAGTVAKGVARGGFTGAEMGALSPVLNTPTDPSQGGFADTKAGQVKAGAVAGGSVGAASSLAGGVVNKAVNATRNLSPRFAQVEEALTAAMGADGTVNQRTFAAALNSAPGAKFAGPEKWEVDGLQKLVAHIQAAPARLDRARDALTTMSMVAHGPLAPLQTLVGPGFTVVKLARVLYGSRAGRNFLLAASDLQPGSGAMQRLTDTILGQIPKLTAGAEARAAN